MLVKKCRLNSCSVLIKSPPSYTTKSSSSNRVQTDSEADMNKDEVYREIQARVQGISVAIPPSVQRMNPLFLHLKSVVCTLEKRTRESMWTRAEKR